MRYGVSPAVPSLRLTMKRSGALERIIFSYREDSEPVIPSEGRNLLLLVFNKKQQMLPFAPSKITL